MKKEHAFMTPASCLEGFRGDTDTWTVISKHLGMVVFPLVIASGPEMVKKVLTPCIWLKLQGIIVQRAIQ